jgi:hypothetical protein
MAWSVQGYETNNDADTIKVKEIAAGSRIQGDKAIIFNSAVSNPRFVPTSLGSNATVTSTYARGYYCDSLVADFSDVKLVYEFRNGDAGVGFYHIEGSQLVPGGQVFGAFGTTNKPGTEHLVLGTFYNAVLATGIEQVRNSEQHSREAIYSIEGVRMEKEPAHGIYIKNGRKYVK